MAYELGNYIVNGQKYTNKIQAILEAQKTLADITWDFHNDFFNKIDWTIEPQLSLPQMYKVRAQQIRDQYDYIVIMFSGGADSTNVLYSFLDNNIRVDEIVASAPMSGLNNWNWNEQDTSVNNTISETKYALFPILDEVAVKFPNVKITINDYFEDIIKYKTDEWLYRCQDWINPVSFVKGNLDKFKHLVNLAEQGKRIGVVWGAEKPILRYDNGSIYSLVADGGVNVPDPPFTVEYPNVDKVLFYWTADYADIMVKQSHVAAKYAYKKENLWLVDAMKQLSNPGAWVAADTNNPKGDWQRGIIPAIYPTTFKDVFQCQKSNIAFMPLQHDWFYTLHKDTRIYQLIESDFKLFHKNINPKYFALNGKSFIKFNYRHKIGHYNAFMENTL